MQRFALRSGFRAASLVTGLLAGAGLVPLARAQVTIPKVTPLKVPKLRVPKAPKIKVDVPKTSPNAGYPLSRSHSSPLKASALRSRQTTIAATVQAISGDTLTLDAGQGATVSAKLLPSTVRSRIEAKRDQPWQAGDSVVARVASFSNGHVTVVHLWDADVYAAEQQRRHETVSGHVKFISAPLGADGLLIVRGDDGLTTTFTLTTKTDFYKGDSVTTAAAYPVGAIVAVKPRALPSGGTAAVIVADDEEHAEQAYRDNQTVWRGQVLAIDAEKSLLTILRSDNARRTVFVPGTIAIYDEKERRKVSKHRYVLTDLNGHDVIVRVDRNTVPRIDGNRAAFDVTISGWTDASALQIPDTDEETAASNEGNNKPVPASPDKTP